LITEQTGEGTFVSHYDPVRPMPKADAWFENVWNAYRERMAKITK